MTTVFVRLLREQDKGGALAAEVGALRRGEGSARRFEVAPGGFAKVPTSPFAYWVSDRVREMFQRLPAFEGDGRTVKQGLATADDFRFVRAWWEVRPWHILDGRNGPDWREDLEGFQEWCRARTHQGRRWAPFAKGGEYSPFYADLHLVVNWEAEGAEIKAWAGSLYNNSHWSRIIKSTDFYFRPGLTWPLRGVRFSTQAVPAGACFSVAGKMAFVPGGDLVATLGLSNSTPLDNLIALFAGKIGGVQYEVGLVGRVPIPAAIPSRIDVLVAEALELKRATASWNELDHCFVLPSLLAVPGGTLEERLAEAGEVLQRRHARLAAIQAEIDELCFAAYGFTEEDRRAALEAEAGPAMEDVAGDDAGEEGEEADGESAAPVALDPRRAAADLVSWCVGVVMGRFDVRLATGGRPGPELGDPFDPLPVCSPGMLQDDEGLPVYRTPPGYPMEFDDDGILADHPGHRDDLVARVREVLQVVFGDGAEAREQEACRMLGVRDLRAYFRRMGAGGFWSDHVKRYSMSRRAAPIYWLLASPENTVRVWVYAHRLERDTLYKVLGPWYLDGLMELLRQQAREVAAGRRSEELAPEEHARLAELMTRMLDAEAFAGRIKDVLGRLDDQGALVGYKPDLDDGIMLAAAPLAGLIPWPETVKRGGRRMSKLEALAQELEEGKYDWARVAMRYWPERVEAACARDRSLALAHDRTDLHGGGQE